MSDLHRPKKIYTYLIWGGWYGSRNIGDSAILLGIKSILETVNADRNYYIHALSIDTDYTCTHGVTGQRALIKSDVFRPWRWVDIVRIFYVPDMVIVSGGTPIFDHSHAIRTLYLLLPCIFRKKFVIFGAGVKKINTPYARYYLRKLLNRSSSISVRDKESKNILEELGVTNISVSADSAFFAKPAPFSSLIALLGRWGLAESEKLLVVAPRLLSKDKHRLYLEEQMSDNVINSTPQKLAAAIDSVSSRFDKIVLMAMHYYGPDSDLETMRLIQSYCKSTNVVVIEQELRPCVAIALFEHATVVCGVRLHSLLLSSSMGTPIVGIAYEKKVQELMERLQLSDYCLDLFDFDASELEKLILKALDNRDSIRQELNLRIKVLREKVIEQAEQSIECPLGSDS